MRVAYLGFNDPRSHARGVEFVILAQSRAIERGYYFFLGAANEVFRWRGLICISVCKNFAWPFALNLLLIGLIRRKGGVLIHAHNYLMAAVLIRRPDLFTVHDGLAYLKSAFGQNSRIFGWLEAWVYRRSRKLHFISEFARSMAHPAGTRKPNFVLFNTCTRELVKVPNDENRLLEPWPRPYALMVRGIEARAGLDLVLDVAERLQISDIDLDIVVAGKGPLLTHYRQLVEERGLTRIHFLGYVDDVSLAKLYSAARLVINPALYGEGFGLPVVEAYYFGKRALASDVCALPEIIMSRDDLFANTVDGLWEALRGALVKCQSPAHDEKRAEDARREYYASKFGAARYLSAWKDIYRSAGDARA